MADTHIKLTNTTKYGIGFTRPTGMSESIQPGRFVTLTMDEIAYEGPCMAKWLASGELTTDSNEVYEKLGISREHAIVAMSDAEIGAKLALSMKPFMAWLGGLEDEAVLSRVHAVACKADSLTIQKVEAIEAKTGRPIAGLRKLNGGDA